MRMAKVAVAVETLLGHGEGSVALLRDSLSLEALRLNAQTDHSLNAQNDHSLNAQNDHSLNA